MALVVFLRGVNVGGHRRFRPARARPSLPIILPPHGRWLVRLIATKGRFVVGVYRRHMKTIGHLGRIDRLFGVPATTRNWNTIAAIVRILTVPDLTP